MTPDVRTTLLENALHLFARKGYENVGVQEVVLASGVTKPTLYHYFGSKRGLLEAIFKEKFAPLDAALAAVVAAPPAELEALLTQVAQHYFAFARAHPAFFRLFLAMVFAPPESDPCQVVSSHAARHHHTLVHLLAALQTPAWRTPPRRHGRQLPRPPAQLRQLVSHLASAVG